MTCLTHKQNYYQGKEIKKMWYWHSKLCFFYMETVYGREILQLKEERVDFSINNARKICYCVIKTESRYVLDTVHNFSLD